MPLYITKFYIYINVSWACRSKQCSSCEWCGLNCTLRRVFIPRPPPPFFHSSCISLFLLPSRFICHQAFVESYLSVFGVLKATCSCTGGIKGWLELMVIVSCHRFRHHGIRAWQGQQRSSHVTWGNGGTLLELRYSLKIFGDNKDVLATTKSMLWGNLNRVRPLTEKGGGRNPESSRRVGHRVSMWQRASKTPAKYVLGRNVSLNKQPRSPFSLTWALIPVDRLLL